MDRVIASMERKAARGGWCGGRAPYGYAVDTDRNFLVPNEDEAALVPVIFDLYSRRQLGTRAVANWLNSRAHPTRTGRPWSHTAILTILRHRAYVGEVYFRGEHYGAPHVPLVDHDLFNAVQEILIERGDDHSKRASNASEYLLAGLIRCGSCDKAFVGTAATGNRYRYRYYTCYSRQRYGRATCGAERLPADELEMAILKVLLDIYEHSEPFAQATSAAWERVAALQGRHGEELKVTEAELRRAEEAIERYLSAFESGSMPEAVCGERVRALGAQTAELRERRRDLMEMLDSGPPSPPRAAELAELRGQIREAIETGATLDQKRLLRALVHDIKAVGCRRVKPTFRVPTNGAGDAKVRAMSGSVGRQGLEPCTLGLKVPCSSR